MSEPDALDETSGAATLLGAVILLQRSNIPHEKSHPLSRVASG